MRLRYGWRFTIGTAARHVALRAAGYPTAVNLEVARRCNARCDFCRYPQVREDPRLDDYLPVSLDFLGESEAPLDWERLKLAASAYWVERPRTRRPLPDLSPTSSPTSSVLDVPLDAA